MDIKYIISSCDLTTNNFKEKFHSNSPKNKKNVYFFLITD